MAMHVIENGHGTIQVMRSDWSRGQIGRLHLIGYRVNQSRDKWEVLGKLYRRQAHELRFIYNKETTPPVDGQVQRYIFQRVQYHSDRFIGKFTTTLPVALDVCLHVMVSKPRKLFVYYISKNICILYIKLFVYYISKIICTIYIVFLFLFCIILYLLDNGILPYICISKSIT